MSTEEVSTVPTFIRPQRVTVTEGGSGGAALVVGLALVVGAVERAINGAAVALEPVITVCVIVAALGAVASLAGVAVLVRRDRGRRGSAVAAVPALPPACMITTPQARARAAQYGQPQTRGQLEARTQAAEDALLWALGQIDARPRVAVLPDLGGHPRTVPERAHVRALTEGGDQ